MKKNNYYLPLLACLVLASSCKKQENQDALGLNGRTVAYTSVTEPITTRSIGPSNLSNIALGDVVAPTIDNSQAWFDFRGTANAQASKRESWHLGFWNGSGLNRVILNYSVTTQASLLSGVTGVPVPNPSTANTALETAYNKINGGTFGMGDLSTFDFHREGQFVIGTPDATSNRVFLIKTPPVEIHPDTTSGGAPVSVSYWIASFKWNATGTVGYSIQYRALQRTGTTWSYIPGSSLISDVIAKGTATQYNFFKLGKPGLATVQPSKNDWNLGLSAVTLKRYMSNGDAYPFALKGLVLNNNPGVSVYRVQTTGSNAGAPGPYDPNFSWTSDPALNSSNAIDAQFASFNSANIDDSKFSSNNQEEIGQYWRYLDMGNYNVFVDRFYVIKLPNGDVYKLKFENLSSSSTSNPVNDGIKFKYTKIATTP